jgi:hypothetical protein
MKLLPKVLIFLHVVNVKALLDVGSVDLRVVF